MCHKTVCGDGIKEGFEQCDDGNLIPYDGCSPTCTIEPKCAGGTCTAVCGDGLKFPQEQCDDGNTITGDGCSSTCTIETGLDLHRVTNQAPPTHAGHPHPLPRHALHAARRPRAGAPRLRGLRQRRSTGLVKAQLGSDSEPVLASNGSPTAA